MLSVSLASQTMLSISVPAEAAAGDCVQAFGRVAGAVPALQQRGEGEACVLVPRVERDGGRVLIDGLVQAPELLQQDAVAETGRDVPRLGGDQPAKAIGRAVQGTVLLEGGAVAAGCGQVPRVEQHRFAQFHFCGFGLAQAQQQVAQVEARLRVFAIEGDRLPVTAHRFNGPAVPFQQPAQRAPQFRTGRARPSGIP